MINSVIFIDLYLSIKSPFKSREGRMKWYWLVIITSTVIFGIFVWNYDTHFGYHNNCNLTLVTITAIFCLVTFPAFILVMRRLLKENTSKHLKDKILRRHSVYFCLYMCFIAQSLLIFVIGTVDESHPNYNDNVYQLILHFRAFLYLDGILVVLVRLLYEPMIKTSVKADIDKFCCRNKQPSKCVYANETLDSFLNSALNIEFVYLLLLGIKTYYKRVKELN